MAENNTKIDLCIMPDTDRAISNPDDDQYGFIELAQKLAPSVIAATQTDGMVIGVEGKWGSGKTSLLNFLHSELSKQGDQKDIHVISIAPWLQGDENDLAALKRDRSKLCFSHKHT